LVNGLVNICELTLQKSLKNLWGLLN